LYRRFSVGGEWYVTPLGILDMATGEFTKILHPLNFWGATIVTP
jgi:hypothetical protein